jgi:hypothetical protein
MLSAAANRSEAKIAAESKHPYPSARPGGDSFRHPRGENAKSSINIQQ